jgi:short-subunit dehydrogenase
MMLREVVGCLACHAAKVFDVLLLAWEPGRLISLFAALQVGIYGYAAYSVSKFALRGLGEALQHEIIAHNIHVSLIFPPDTETPGLEEGKRCL